MNENKLAKILSIVA